ncbi:MAG: hypothetical protein IPL22_04895 [Bacteroidetes bacterium]|nr:hypothetical protein [Bacteroidota bacterium]
MKKLIYVSFFGVLNLISLKGNCQYNLVPNPSFELFTNCPTSYGQIAFASYWTKPVTNVSPEFLHGYGPIWAGVPQNSRISAR